jgi:hypothetical protein
MEMGPGGRRRHRQGKFACDPWDIVNLGARLQESVEPGPMLLS